MKRSLPALFMSGSFCLAVLFSTAGIASAAGKFTKKESEVVANQTELTKPEKKIAETQPTLTAKALLPGNREPQKAATDGQIKLMERLSAMTQESDPEKPDLLFRFV